MPTVLRLGGLRFYFYSIDLVEPPHIHVDQGEKTAKFWLTPIEIEWSEGFNRTELNRIRMMVEQHQEDLLRSWHEFGTR